MAGSDGGLMMKIGGIIALLVLVSPSFWAADDEGYYTNHKHRVEQNVEAEGYCMIYQIVDSDALHLQNSIRGSGIMDASTLISTNRTKLNYYPQDKYTLVYGSPVYGYDSNISFVGVNDMSYAPMAVAYGSGYYAKNPIVYNSKLEDGIEGKSYRQGVSMDHQIEYASALQKYINVDLWWKDAINCTDPPVYGFGLARMGVEETVTEGEVHVGELVADSEYGWKRPQIEIDENYVGNIKLTSEMEVSTTESPETLERDWLSCCDVGGYYEMEDDDKIWDEQEIFDGRSRNLASWDES